MEIDAGLRADAMHARPPMQTGRRALPGIACVRRRPPDRRGDGCAGRVAGLGPSPSGTGHRAPALASARRVPSRSESPRRRPRVCRRTAGFRPRRATTKHPDATAARVAARKRTALSASAAHAPTRDAVSMLPPFRTAGTRVAGRPAPPTNAPPRGR
ncbi:hypothetical protein BUH_5785 [Burkholderia pseudomallei Pakistan 9]|nr:hypothetical protein BUH_5785 [Burkholderia pseudomallei Pakistan 9]